MVSTSSLPELSPHIEFLRKCQSNAQRIKDLIGARLTIPQAPAYNGPIPDLNLTFPYDILQSVDDLGLPKHLSEQIQAKVSEKVFQSQKICIELFQRTCHQLPGPFASSDYLNNLANTFRKFYNEQQVPELREKISISKATLAMVNKNYGIPSKRPNFNFEYTPMLEKYFEQNAYPSRPDRLLLARKSSMSERQIEVWFQNHRNRSKKDGIPLKRINPHQTVPSDFSAREIPHATALNRASSSSQDDISMQTNRRESLNTVVNRKPDDPFLNLTPTLHTFPTPYRRDPKKYFVGSSPQQESTIRFPHQNWPRKPAIQPLPSSTIDMDEFIAMFALKLDIRRGSGMKSTRKTSEPWFSATVTIPSPAPHPALIRTKAIFHASIPRLPFWKAASSPRTLSNISNSSLSSASETLKRVPKPRKMAPFTYRAPQKLFSLPTSDASRSSQPSDSRTSSFASVSSFQSRSSSILSTGSSPGPTTPPHSPTNDTHIVHESVIPELTSDKYIDDLFAGVPPDAPQNFDDFLNNINNEDLFSDKHLPTSTHNFPYLDSLYAAA